MDPQGVTGDPLRSVLLNAIALLHSAPLPAWLPFTTSLFSTHLFQNRAHDAAVTDQRGRPVLVNEEGDVPFAFAGPGDLEQTQLEASGTPRWGRSGDRTGTVAAVVGGLSGKGGDPRLVLRGSCWFGGNLRRSWGDKMEEAALSR